MRELIASVGAGRMGRGIAITFALAGHKVCLIDVKNRKPAEFVTLRNEASAEIAATLSMLSELGLVRRADVDAVAKRVSYSALGEGQAALADADVIFEAVPETIDAKQVAFAWISKFSKKMRLWRRPLPPYCQMICSLLFSLHPAFSMRIG